MPIAEMIRNQSPFDVLPTWRKWTILCCVGATVVVGFLTFNRDMNIYGRAPDHPVVATAQTFLVLANHGSARYVTQREKDRLEFWEANAGLLAGGPMLLAFFLWISYQPRRHR